MWKKNLSEERNETMLIVKKGSWVRTSCQGPIRSWCKCTSLAPAASSQSKELQITEGQAPLVGEAVEKRELGRGEETFQRFEQLLGKKKKKRTEVNSTPAGYL